MRLRVVIVKYGTANLTIDALASLEAEIRSVAPSRVIVFDNRSDDGAGIAARQQENPK